MMQFERIEQSRAHLALVRALSVTEEACETAEGRARSEYAYVAACSPKRLSEALLLANALQEHAGCQPFRFMMKELAVTCDDLELAESAGRLLGAVHIGRGIWSTAPDQNAQRIDIPQGLFRGFLEDWSGYLPASNCPPDG